MSAERLTRPDGPKPGVGIVHLGLGAFFRAFGVPWIGEAVQASGGEWGLVGVSLRSPLVRNALAPQGFVYTAAELAPEGTIYRQIDGVQDVLVATEGPEAVLSAMAIDSVKIVSLTITEKGYCHNPATGKIDLDNPDIRADLAGELPKSAPGFIVRALQRRKAAGRRPFTVLSCDNLADNGRLIRGVILGLAERIDPPLARWIEAECRFPSTMVDRIVPATKPEDIARVEAETGLHDAAPVIHEPFRQWVIEDDFVDGARPDLGAVGVQMVEDVRPYEHMKLRMLNGVHSSLAYLGYLAGHETIADTVGDPVFETFAEGLWRDEIIPALTPPPDTDPQAYAARLLGRFRNPQIRHRTWQIAADGSQKLPQRVFPTIAGNIAAGRSSDRLLLAVAAWMRYVGGVDESGNAIDVQDPLAERLRLVSDSVRPEQRAAVLLSVREVFPKDLAEDIETGVVAAYDRLLAVGARRAVEELE